VQPQNPAYPARLDIDYPDHLSRLMIFVKGVAVLPHYIALMLLGIGAFVVLVLSWFAVLFTGRYPRGLFNYMVGVLRWGARVSAYQFLQTDKYPPFTLADDPTYPVRLEIDYPERIPRWAPLFNGLLVFPAAIAASVVFLCMYGAVLIGWFAILFTGRFPRGLFNVVTIGFRWNLRVTAFRFFMTGAYPPFVWA
jgi:hypothetical protein